MKAFDFDRECYYHEPEWRYYLYVGLVNGANWAVSYFFRVFYTQAMFSS